VVVGVTGVGFPLLSFVTRKALFSMVGSYLKKKLERGIIDREHYLRTYNRLAKIVSIGILVVLTLLLYLNRSVPYALLSAIAQIFIEIVGKCYVAYSTKYFFKSYIKSIEGKHKNTLLAKAKVKALMASQEASVNTDMNDPSLLRSENAELRLVIVELKEIIAAKDEKNTALRRRLKQRKNNTVEDDHEDSDRSYSDSGSEEDEEDVDYNPKTTRIKRIKNDSKNETDVAEVRLKYVLGMLALQWNSDIVAEKSFIFTAALIANLYLRDLTGFSGGELAAVAAMFFFAEIITDMSLTYTMSRFFDIPMLSASPREDFFSKGSISSLVMLAVTFIAMAALRTLIVSPAPQRSSEGSRRKLVAKI